jgi:zinc transporter, ZIP family
MEYSVETVAIAFGLTVLAGLSTGIGAALAFFSRGDNTRVLSIGLGFSAGVMMYVSFVEILAKSKSAFAQNMGDIASEVWMLGTFFGGFALAFLIDRLIPDDVNPHELRSDKELHSLKSSHETHPKHLLKRTGVFTAIAIAIHNFPEGFATFVASLEGMSLGIAIALAVAIHNIPEGMAVSLPIYHATGDRKKAFGYAFLSGLAEPIGAVVGFFVLMPFMGDLTLGITFGMVAGIMIYISLDELLPSARVYGNAHTAIAGIALGMAVMASSLLFFKASGIA